MITIDYTSYAEGQKDWAAHLDRESGTPGREDLAGAAAAVLERVRVMLPRIDIGTAE